MKKKLKMTQLNKKSIAKLNEEQLSALKGGKGKGSDVPTPTSSYTCNTSTCS